MKTAHKDKLKYRGTCPHCPQSEDCLPMDTVLYNGFGGYVVYHNQEHFYSGSSRDEWEDFWKLDKIEKIAVKMGGKWEVVLNSPLRGATWVRIGENEWALTETNLGFA